MKRSKKLNMFQKNVFKLSKSMCLFNMFPKNETRSKKKMKRVPKINEMRSKKLNAFQIHTL